MKILNTDKTLNELLSIKYDNYTHVSNNVVKNSIFIALNGQKTNGSKYIQEAIAKGATLIISEDVSYDYSSIKVPVILYENFRPVMAKFLNNYFNIDLDKIIKIGITGTNGKTTTTFILEHFLKNSTRIGTNGIRIGKNNINSKNTTPESIEILNHIDNSIKENIKYLIMEVSSHSLTLNRVNFLNYDYGIFTNLSQDHLDFHQNMQEYFNAKLKLIEQIKKGGTFSVNLDNEYTKKITKEDYKDIDIAYFSCINKNADVYGEILEYKGSKMRVKIDAFGKSITFNTSLLGRYNLENILSTIPILLKEGFSLEDIKDGMESISTIPGRLETIMIGNKMVVIDFAHTPDGLLNVTKTLKEIAKNKLIVVFGAGGSRDKTKRPQMMQKASQYADFVVLTSDNPREEKIEDILLDIEKGAEKVPYIKINDRKEAIKYALNNSKEYDIILIAGKGHENYQIFKDKTIYFSDRDEVIKYMNIENEVKRQMEIITHGIEEVINEVELEKKIRNSLETNTPLKIKLGIDPTGSDLHLGHAVPIRKLKEFQELGHDIYFVIGTFTGKIGDPTGKSDTRVMQTDEQVQENMKNYLKQLSKILDISKINVVYNSDWLEKISLSEFLNILSHVTVSQMISREDFSKRLSENKPVSLVEFMYPLLQGYDSVALNADVELGATEQKFNLLKGRDLQKIYSQKQQICLMVPILVGLDGVQKMSKSLNNYIGIDDSPNDMFGKIMSISDTLMLTYYDYLTDFSIQEIKKIKEDIVNNKIHPMTAKKDLAESLVRVYYGDKIAKEARNWFENVFSNKNLNVELEQLNIDEQEITLFNLIQKYTNVYKSNSDIRRVIEQGGIKINDESIKDMNKVINVKTGDILKLGKKSIFKLKRD